MDDIRQYIDNLTEQAKREEQASLSLLSTESERLQELLQFQLQIASIEELVNDIKRYLDDISRNVHALKESTHTILLYELNMLHVFSNWMNADDVQQLKQQLQSSLQQTINLNVNQTQKGDNMSFTTGNVDTNGGKFQQAVGDITEGDKVTVQGATAEWLNQVHGLLGEAVASGEVDRKLKPAIDSELKSYAEEIDKGSQADADKVGGVLGRLVDMMPMDTFHVISAALPLGPFNSLVEVTKKMQSKREAEKLEARLQQIEKMAQGKAG